ncbi:MAG: N-glycosylase/DNA lyase [Thermosipho sp. (in: thermotogales)]|nr:N-glycosylase/DNA lyase [Thermosipho sp. (in: thermotogales)]MDN5324840.1 N-glycosylase/DNA lyase [Thermosipho sp. (in: thermotogales)]
MVKIKKLRKLLEDINSILDIAKNQVEKRWEEFKKIGKQGSEEDLFVELSFCVLTANWSAKGGIKAQEEIGKGFITYSLDELELALRKVGHRFPKARAKYIFQNRWVIGNLKKIITLNVDESREYLVKNIKGIGWKESSHFLRNVGICDVAILDKHILRILKEYELIEQIPKSWSKNRYLEIEKIFKKVSKMFEECPGKFDLYLWYYLKGVVEK